MIDNRTDKKNDDKPEKITTYYVNAEKFKTEEKKLTVRFILENANFKPVENHYLLRDNGDKKFENYDEEIPVHNNETFTAIFNGVTPVSGV